MFNKEYRPNCHNFRMFYCDYDRIKYCYRQKMRQVESLLLDITRLSRKVYVLYLGQYECALVDTLDNKMLWTLNYTSSVKELLGRLEELKRFWRYENTSYKIRNCVEDNDFRTLAKKYLYERQN